MDAAHLALESHHPSARRAPDDQTGDLDTAKADFKVAWERLLAKTSKDELAAAYKDLNIRDDG